ncbi:unnamed protein product [Porites evermanni]|uniref:EF-hand domain-containing protein n=1 Tax=Porites evermanni TaxID=104178 RepID=A0ABN8R3E6_9CNID|nr:unnamed protein product [Porites evermanni]
MARKNYLVWTCFVWCILIGLFDLRIHGKDSSIKLGTCVNEESEDGFCDSNDENKYLENNENLHAEETKGSTLQEKEEITTFIENSEVNISESEVNQSLLGSEDKQTDIADNSTDDWLGLRIPVVDGVEVGHVQEVEILPGVKRQMKTLSMRPLVFEIPDFLDADECELIIALAENKRLRDNPKRTDSRGILYEDPVNTFKLWDLNGDNYIDTEEIVLIPGKMDLKFTEINATEMYVSLEMDKDDNGKIDLTEFKSIELERMQEYIAALLNDSSLRRIASSKISWLWHDEDELLRYQPELLDGFHERLQAITKIPKEILQEISPRKVSQYEEGSYQYCQQDSEPTIKGVPCCLYGDMDQCRICRFITITYFLTDVDDGGEVVVPLANNKFEEDVMNNSGNWTGFFTYAKTTGSRNSFKVDIKFKVDGANKILVGKGHDASGAFELIDSLVTGDIVRFRKKYLNQENNDMLIKYAGRLKGNAQIEGKWWIPGEKKIHGFFFMRYEAYEKWMNDALGKCNSYEYCSKGNLVIKPQRGKAIMWYNHVINDEGNWIGGLDNRMHYGHCDVSSGEKWIATNWINVDGEGDMELRAWRKGSNLLSVARRHGNQNILQRMQKSRDRINTDVIEEEMQSDMENNEEWTFHDSHPKERHVLNAVTSLLETLKEDELRSVSKKVHEKLEMLCVPLVLNQGGKISLVDGSKAD